MPGASDTSGMPSPVLAEVHVGVVGLGAVGARLATRLGHAGASVVVHDIDAGRVSTIEGDNIRRAESVAALARVCEHIVLSLPSAQAVREVMQGPTGIVAAARTGCVIVDTSTIDPQTGRDMEAVSAAAGLGYLDAPVTCAVTDGGGVAAAACGELTFLVGGDAGHLARARPVLEALGRKIHHLGPAGAGSTMKLITNHISGVTTLAVAEGLSLAAAAGFDPRDALMTCEDTVANTYVLSKIVKARLGGFEGAARGY